MGDGVNILSCPLCPKQKDDTMTSHKKVAVECRLAESRMFAFPFPALSSLQISYRRIVAGIALPEINISCPSCP
jgi:hypothetical protein